MQTFMESNPKNQQLVGSIATLPPLPPHFYYSNTWETERLFLRPFTAEDLTALAQVYRNPEVMRFVDLTGKTLSETQAELSSYINHWKQHNFGNFAIIHKASETLIGRTGLYLNDRSPYPQFGYVLDRPYWGQGLGTEVAQANLDYGFNILKFEQITAFVMRENLASRKILSEKLGMHCLTDKLIYFGVKCGYYIISRQEYLKSEMLSDLAEKAS